MSQSPAPLSEELRASALWLRSLLAVHPEHRTLTLAGDAGTVTYTRGEGLTVTIGGDEVRYPESALDDERWETAA